MSVASFNEQTAAWLAEARRVRGVSQEDLAATLGVSQMSISNWERGICMPGAKHYAALQQYFQPSKYPLEITFRRNLESLDPWQAYRAAEDYCRTQGWSVGSMQCSAPTAVFEDGVVSKWRNLSASERAGALATITRVADGLTFRNADVILRIAREPEERVPETAEVSA